MKLGATICIAVTALSITAAVTTDHVLKTEQSKLKTEQSSAARHNTTSSKPTTSSTSAEKPQATQSTTTQTKSITAESAYDQFVNTSQEYLTAYMSQVAVLKAQPKNISHNAVLAPIALKFGQSGIPDTSNTPVEHLLFNPYAYTNPKMTFSSATSKGNGLYNGLLTVNADNADPQYIQFEYNTKTNIITVVATLIKAPTGAESNQVPTSPVFKELQ